MGRNGHAWEKERAKQKVKFLGLGITECEVALAGCWRNNALGFAHSKKRRNLKPHELSEVVLACNPCHDQLELLPEKEMTRRVREIIARRIVKKNLEKKLAFSDRFAILTSHARIFARRERNHQTGDEYSGQAPQSS